MIKEKIYSLLVQVPQEDVPTEVNPLPGGENLTVAAIIISIINFILQFAAALAVLMIIIGGVRYITSAGNDAALEQARKIIIYSILGLVIIILSFVIVNFVLKQTPVIIPPR